jgi:Popeye protein conserved region
MSIQPIDLLVHFGNVLLLISYSVRSMLLLRWFAVASALTVVPYYLAQERVLWPPVSWALVFTAINLYQIARLYAERRPAALSPDEQKLYDLGFQALRPREFLSLALLGEWKDAAAGDRLLSEGERVAAVRIATTGVVEARRQKESLALMKPGQVIGTALALTDTPSPVSATFIENGRYIEWPLEQLRTFLDRRPELRLALQRHVSQDLARKLELALSAGGPTNSASS